VALSTLALIISGFGQMPMYKRYYIADLPGLGWSADYSITLLVHYLAAMVLFFAVTFHLVYHLITKDYDLVPKRGDLRASYLIIKAMVTKQEAPPSGKYLAEQRLVYAFFAFSFMIVGITGLLKVLKNLPAVNFSEQAMIWISNLHNVSAFLVVFGIITHLAAFLFRENRPLLPAVFTGKVDLDYIKHRHGLWYARLLSGRSPVVSGQKAAGDGRPTADGQTGKSSVSLEEAPDQVSEERMPAS
jgi:cytochrome b subunit of formate dehydrogenase